MNRLLGRRTFKAARPILRNYYAAFTSASSSASSGLKPTCGGYDTWALPDLDPEADYTLVEELETSYDIQSELLNMRIHKLLDKLGILEESERDKFVEKYEISPGHFSLEWCLPSPPPEHCFDEQPIVKNFNL